MCHVPRQDEEMAEEYCLYQCYFVYYNEQVQNATQYMLMMVIRQVGAHRTTV